MSCVPFFPRYWDGNVDGDYEDTDEGTQYYLQDANYNVTAVVDDGGTVLERYSYTPYGEVTVLDPNFTPDSVSDDGLSDIGNTHLYTGRERDPESGLQLNGHRYYAPRLGRWVCRDPIGYDAGTYNLYEYVASKPVVGADPSGLAWIHWILPFVPKPRVSNNLGRDDGPQSIPPCPCHLRCTIEKVCRDIEDTGIGFSWGSTYVVDTSWICREESETCSEAIEKRKDWSERIDRPHSRPPLPGDMEGERIDDPANPNKFTLCGWYAPE